MVRSKQLKFLETTVNDHAAPKAIGVGISTHPAAYGSHPPYKSSSLVIHDQVDLRTLQLLGDLAGGHLQTADMNRVSSDRRVIDWEGN